MEKMKFLFCILCLCSWIVNNDGAVPEGVLRRAKMQAAQRQQQEKMYAAKMAPSEKTDQSEARMDSRQSASERAEQMARARIHELMIKNSHAKTARYHPKPYSPVGEKTIMLTDMHLPRRQAASATRRRQRGFRATNQRCCKLGERAGKKRLSCDLSLHSLYRGNAKYASESEAKYSNILFEKFAKCSEYKKNFEKCCYYRQHFFKELGECKKLRGYKRRNCRKHVRSRYP